MGENLAANLMYGAAVCPLCNYRKPDALPAAGDMEGLASFWKKHCNTLSGKDAVNRHVYKARSTKPGKIPKRRNSKT